MSEKKKIAFLFLAVLVGIFLIRLTSAANYEYGTGGAQSGGSIDYTEKFGVKLVISPDTSNIIQLLNVTKDITDSGNRTYIMDSGFNVLNTSNFTGVNANLTYDLMPGNTYYIVTDCGGAGCNHSNVAQTFPVVNTYLNFTAGRDNGGDTSSSVWAISKIGINVTSSFANMFGPCNASLTVPYLNISFFNEQNLTNITGNIPSSVFSYQLGNSSINSFIYSNTTDTTNKTFCAGVAGNTYNLNISNLQIASTGYPQRVFSERDLVLTSALTNKSYALLPAANGIYTTIQTVQSIGSIIQGVHVTVERLINGVFVPIGEQDSDSSGIVTFWVDPNSQIRVTASKTGYTTNQVIISPSQTQYTLTMNPTSGNTTYTSDTSGMQWVVFPATGRVNGTTLYGINLTAANGNLVSCMMNLTRSDNGTVISSTIASGTTGCNLSASINIPTEIRIFGQFYVNTTTSNGYFPIELDALWYQFQTNSSSPWDTVTSLFHDLNNYPEFGNSELRQEFSKVIIFFFFLILFIGILTFFTEYDRIYPGFFIVLVFACVAVASAGGFLTLNFGTSITGQSISLPQTLQQYTVMMIAGLLMFGYLLNRFSAET